MSYFTQVSFLSLEIVLSRKGLKRGIKTHNVPILPQQNGTPFVKNASQGTKLRSSSNDL
jgi:hypothetical protein